MFSIESRDPTLAADDVVREMGLVTLDDYIARCDAAQRAGRGA
jgi:hypothetical protein